MNLGKRVAAMPPLSTWLALPARELVSTLALPTFEALRPWLKRLLDWNLVQSAGRTQATRYVVNPGLLRSLNFTGGTTLKSIEPHRSLALIVEDVGRYPGTKIGDIHQRVALETPRSRVRRAVEQLVKDGKLSQEGGAVAHVTTRPNLAQNGGHPPSGRQSHAPSRAEFLLTHCRSSIFSLAHSEGVSQSTNHRSDVNLSATIPTPWAARASTNPLHFRTQP